MKELSIDDLLRYGLAGGNFLLLYFIQYEPEIPFSGELSKSAAILGISLLVGGILYVLHRAIPFPLFLLPMALHLGGYREPTSTWDNFRAQQMAVSGVKNQAVGEWGAQVHFLYTLCWSTILVPVLGWTSDGQSYSTFAVCLLASIYFMAGTVHNTRLVVFTCKVFESDA